MTHTLPLKTAAQAADSDQKAVERMNRHRNFPCGTCPASRHTAMIAECLINGKPYPMIEDEPEHVAGSLASTVASLWQARAQLHRLGYECRPDAKGVLRWRKAQPQEPKP